MQIIDNDMDKSISIAGVSSTLATVDRNDLQGLSLDLLLNFQFYRTKFNHYDLCIVEPINSLTSYTPRQYSRIGALVESLLKMPVAFRLASAPSYMRIRLIEQGVYFIVSDKYVFLPGVLINEQIRKAKYSEKQLSPVAQYILLYFLQNKKLEEFTIQEIQPCTPYNYLAVSRAIGELEEKRLLHVRKEWKTKFIFSPISRKELWENAMPLMVTPVKKIVYADDIWEGPFYTGGISALSHYSFLNPDNQETLVIWDKDFNPKDKLLVEYGGADLKYKIEIWKYSPNMGGGQDEYVDKLSLFLSLQNDNDPRVEKELEILINDIWQ